MHQKEITIEKVCGNEGKPGREKKKKTYVSIDHKTIDIQLRAH